MNSSFFKKVFVIGLAAGVFSLSGFGFAKGAEESANDPELEK